MKKGISPYVLILALVFLVIIIFVLFIQPGLLREAAEKSLEKAVNESKQEREEPRMAEGNLFGRNLVLVDEKTALKVLGKAVLDCFEMCKKLDRPLFCNYIEMPEGSLWVGDIEDYIDSKRASSLGWSWSSVSKSYVNFRNPNIIQCLGQNTQASCERKAELCCEDPGDISSDVDPGYVYITKLGECMENT